MNYFASNICSFRNRKKLKQSEIARGLGIPRTTWASYETNSSEPSIDGILRISDFFGIDPGKLIGEDLSAIPLADIKINDEKLKKKAATVEEEMQGIYLASEEVGKYISKKLLPETSRAANERLLKIIKDVFSYLAEIESRVRNLESRFEKMTQNNKNPGSSHK